jgi:glycosyltransferase involved in cell wall biosynthesis
MGVSQMKIGWVDVLKERYGGTIYTDMAQSALSKHYDLDRINVGLDHFKKCHYPKILYRLIKVSGQKEIWIRNFDSILTMPYDGSQGKTIALIFHIDQSFQPLYLHPPWIVLEKIFYRHLKKVDAIVTISKYWQNHFGERGYPNVHLIYNAFDTDQFHFEAEEIRAYKKQSRFEGKPIVYLGNCQRIKGVVEAFEQLKGLEVTLVTSGQREVNLPVLNLHLDYKEYRLLLKSSSAVITMSKFKEGWNRTAHEAMLCKTPVIGSGLGGMRELLEGGSQIICEDFGELKEKVCYVLEHPEMGEAGYGFAKQFTVKRFEEEWLNLIERVHEEK